MYEFHFSGVLAYTHEFTRVNIDFRIRTSRQPLAVSGDPLYTD